MLQGWKACVSMFSSHHSSSLEPPRGAHMIILRIICVGRFVHCEDPHAENFKDLRIPAVSQRFSLIHRPFEDLDCLLLHSLRSFVFSVRFRYIGSHLIGSALVLSRRHVHALNSIIQSWSKCFKNMGRSISYRDQGHHQRLCFLSLTEAHSLNKY